MLNNINITEERIQKVVDKIKHNKAEEEDGLVSTYVEDSMKGVKRHMKVTGGNCNTREMEKSKCNSYLFKKVRSRTQRTINH